MPEPVITAIATTAGKMVVEKSMEELIKRKDKVENEISGEFTIEGREMTILCPESIQKYSMSITPKKSHKMRGRKIKLEFGQPRRADIKQVRSLQSIPNAIGYIDNGMVLNTQHLQKGELYVIDIEYKIEDSFIDSIVERHHPRETPSEDHTDYWLVAQLKHLDVLKRSFGRIDIKDIDFGVTVAIHQDINLKIPMGFRMQLESIAKLLRKSGRSQKHSDFMKYLHLQNTKYGGREFELLGELQEIFLPDTFCRFIEVIKDFHYQECSRGTDIYDTLPFPTWPKYMKVISRTDLNLDRPAADGILRYKKKDFSKELEEMFA